ncbi:MAG: valine--tRNA ligase [Elusimicrobia bacterium]|nr:valine--tRNA ligase [Elusimicrobiota bacterium]
MELPKTYDPKPVEAKWLEKWAKDKLFESSPRSSREKDSPFVIVIPPPNITGALHMGHALNNTLQDVLTRFWKMRGCEANWVPGTDHGGIATQNVVEKALKAEGKKRNDLGREKFLERMWRWKQECGNTILEQLKKMGCALDLRPENVRFTMDDVRGKAVTEAFKRLWGKGLIYRGERMINWCVRCGTALSDIEVEHEERDSKLWHIHYPLYVGGEGGLCGEGPVVATTRPESMLGDTAVAVHPEDKRWKHLIGKKCRLPLTDRIIPIIGDRAVDPKFGTGAVKVTPAHDPVDFGIGQRNDLESRPVIGFDGKMTPLAGPEYRGLDRDACRKKVVEDLRAGNLLREEKPYRHSVGVCYRCNQAVEPLVSKQWFLNMEDSARKAIEATKQGKVRFYPQSWEKPYLNWLENIQDWCISRQIWWGHRIPVWYCPNSKETFSYDRPGMKVEVGDVDCKPMFGTELDRPKQCSGCGSAQLEQDPDVLDTWFSSALWPFSVFGWPDKTKELGYYYPTTVLVTGYEILYLWVARMVMMGVEFMGEVPFRDVYIHGIVRDRFGKKMSKSLGNVVDPLVLMEKYGTDAMRFALMTQTVPGRDIQFSEDSIVGARNFCNKIYNATRYILMILEKLPSEVRKKIAGHVSEPQNLLKMNLDLADRWILGRYSQTVQSAKASFAGYRVDESARSIYDFLWGDFCDWYVEISKLSPPEKKTEVFGIVCVVLEGCLKLLHPIMPYITEELWQVLNDKLGKKSEDCLLQQKWPDFGLLPNTQDAESMRMMKDLITAIRTMRSEFGVPPGEKIEVYYDKMENSLYNLYRDNVHLVINLAKVKGDAAGNNPPRNSLQYSLPWVTIYIPRSEVDGDKLKTKLNKELVSLASEIESLSKQLENQDFVSRAPREKVSEIKRRHEEARQRQSRLQEVLRNLN